MMNRMHILAILVAFFLGYVVITALLFATGLGSDSSAVLSTLVVVSYVVQPPLTGALAACMARDAPLRNALAASLLGSVMYGWMMEHAVVAEMAWWLGINAIGAMTGAWSTSYFQKRRNNGK